MVKKKEKESPQKPSLEAFHEEIGELAGEIHDKRIAFNEPGDELSDWLLAEKEIKKKHKP